MTPVSVVCPAKVNLFLRVIAREDSGYHQIETLFQALELHDTVTVAPTDGEVSLSVSWDVPGDSDSGREADLGPADDNTVVRAARRFLTHTGVAGGASVKLVKRIPPGTGLGGASSDAAGVLAALNRLHGDPLTGESLIALGGGVGADVPFFCVGAPTALAWGRGDRVAPLRSLPVAPVVVVVLRDRVSTVDAYRRLSRELSLPAPAARMDLGSEFGWSDVGGLQHNDFERVAVTELPALTPVLGTLQDAGAAVARMTGSGSAAFGVFEDPDRARRALDGCRTLAGVERTILTRTLAAGPLNRLDGLH